ncbi:hypothetical protein RF11_12455 [Thelohanellus kitauei]|uniref:Vacuolar protein sorting/targeting protein 10 n=1 Tax=Thelohanellus kitauei TaxID=669202 RepID=A0A0C2M5Z3_THEKT|nr:hypothetical protein RF11_12455 [Thelohanellus kitauei]
MLEANNMTLNEAKFFDYVRGIYYVVLVHEDLQTCLWATKPTTLYCVKIKCYIESPGGSMESNIFIDKMQDGVIYLNIPSNENEFHTYRTSDGGRFWEIVKFNAINFKTAKPIKFNFELHDTTSVPNYFVWIDIQYQKLTNYFQPFMTMDGGHNWIPVPKSASRVIMLNYETVVISVAQDLSGINYSFDHGNTWLRYRLFQTKLTLVHLVKLSNIHLKALIISRESETVNCQKKDVLIVPIQKSKEYCYRGRKIRKISRKPELLCINRIHEKIEVESICPCVTDDLGW